MPKSSALAHTARTQTLVARRLEKIDRWTRLPGIGVLLLRQRRQLESWRVAFEELLANWSGSSDDVALLFDLGMAAPEGKRHALKYLRAFFAAKRRIFAAIADDCNVALREAIEARMRGVAALRALWRKIDLEATRMMQPRRVALRKAAESLRTELRAIGAGESEPVKALDELLRSAI